MTAINAIASGSRGRMVTDAASYMPDGELVGFVTKAIALPHLGMVFACRGATAARWILVEELEQFGSFDAVIAGAAAALEKAHEADAFGGDLDAVLMGWSPTRRRVELHTLSSVAHGGVAAFTLQAMAITLAPLPDDDALRHIGLKVGRTFDLSRPAEKLRQVIELQRAMLFPDRAGSGAAGHVIGGAVILTEVSEAGITQQVIHRWSDDIGRTQGAEAPRPSPGDRPPQLRVVA